MTQEESLDDRICYRIKVAQAAVHNRMEEVLRPFDLSVSQYAALELIGRFPQATNAQLARAAFVTRQSMNTMLQGLQRRGLVDRADRPTAGRELPTVLTPDGATLLRRASRAVADMESAVARSFTDDERRALMDALDRTVTTLRQG
ncbi:MarR family winged helix-turn-helix transcriptional regulator [Tsukamurella paurometabola]|uniref:DNA-binding transcriptional repressor MarR n=1 Tax=Tsukamurella paurometabola TaxID=2061 RepID=A0A3P8MCM8_TSUPA|nr:MarR family transcriptional regulator [Tsukamurella paurometabola]UEA85356.1 MarR family transcriptional regulator [Tsukamurella paurometabola]VDR37973.1 DNA-binding transcriptional repressor MarR [Tsukamurella paurometabola]